MSYQVEAIFEDGVLKLLEPLKLAEHQIVSLTVNVPEISNPESELEAWQGTYAGLTEHDVDEIEKIAFARDNFMTQGNE